MVHFGKRLASLQYAPWREHYVRYNALKGLLESSPHDDERRDGDVEASFRRELNADIETAVLFSLRRQGELATRLRALRDETTTVMARRSRRRTAVGDVEDTTTTDTTPSSGLLDHYDAEHDDHDPTSTNTNTNTDDDDSAARLVVDDDDTETLSRLRRSYREATETAVQLVRFTEVNLTAVRKILKKHDRIFPQQRIGHLYLENHNNYTNNGNGDVQQQGDEEDYDGDSHLQHFLRYNDGIGPLVTSIRRGFAAVRDVERVLTTTSHDDRPPHHHQAPRRNHTAPDLLAAATACHGYPAESTFSRPPVDYDNSRIHHHHHDNNDNNRAQPPTRVLTSDNLWQLLQQQQQPNNAKARWVITEPALLRLESARRRLHESSTFVRLLAAPSMVEFNTAAVAARRRRRRDHRDDVDDAHDEEDELPLRFVLTTRLDVDDDPTTDRRRRRISNVLNLLSTFLYLTNYYICAPTSGAYAARLHGSPALAGVVMGMTPTAALAGTVLYSYWTTFSYRPALLFAAASAIAGNILYALALPHQSLTYVLVGRLLIGFGSCRSINRRYIADAYAREDRTAASAVFVTAGSLGMAVGPAVAAVLNWIIAPSDETRYWSVENAPGWVMFVVWVVFFVVLLLYFTDPPRHEEESSSSAKPVHDAEEGETNPLLPLNKVTPDGSVTSSFDDDDSSLWRNIPVMATLIVCFLLKMTLECCLSSTATVTAFYFDWNSSHTGVYLALLGLLVFPANLLVAYFSRRYEDRDLIFCTLVFMMLGSWGIVNYGGPDRYTTLQYIGFSVVIFVSTNALEGPNMSLLSKTIPYSWSRGFFNMGLLATEAGTFGRTVGDFVITWFGLGSIESMLNHTFVFLGTLVGMTVIVTYRVFPYLEPRDKDD